MDSPKGGSVEIIQDHGFNSSIVAKITNALDTKISIKQVCEIYELSLLNTMIIKSNFDRQLSYEDQHYLYIGKPKSFSSGRMYSRR